MVGKTKIPLLSALFLSGAFAFPTLAQDVPLPPPPGRMPQGMATQPKLSKLLAANLEKVDLAAPVSAESTTLGFTKLLEGERYAWRVKNARTSQARAQQGANVAAARKAFREAVEANPKLAEGYTALAELAISAPPSDVDESIELANLSIRVNPNNFGARRILARLYTYKSGLGSRALDAANSDRAVNEWKFLASLDPRYAEAWAFLAEFYDRQDKQPERIVALEKWRSSATPIESQFFQQMTGGRTSLAPESAAVPLAEAMIKNGRYGDAIVSLKVVIDDDPDNFEATSLLRQALEQQIVTAKNADREADVLAAIKQARETLGASDTFADRQLVAYYRESGRRDQALTSIRTLRAKNPLDESLARQEAMILTELGKVDDAVAGYRKHFEGQEGAALRGATDGSKVVIQRPRVDAFSSELYISQLYTSAGRHVDSMAAARKALAVADGAERRQIARLSIATAMQASGDHAGAETTLRDILKESPDNPIAQNNLGYFLVERGERLDEALELIRKAIDTEPTNPSYLDSLGWAFFKMDKLGEAEMYLKEALRHDPTSSTINEHLGDVYEKQGKAGEAKAYWQRALKLASDAVDVTRLQGKVK